MMPAEARWTTTAFPGGDAIGVAPPWRTDDFQQLIKRKPGSNSTSTSTSLTV